MKAYLVLSGGIFGLVGVAHLVRMFVEGGHGLADDPIFFVSNVVIFCLGAGLAGWASRLLRRLRVAAA